MTMVDLGHGDAATAPAQAPRLTLPGWLRDASQTQRALSALILLSLYNAFFTTNFLTWATLRVNLTQVATIVIVGVGMTLVIATGGIDLSVGALMAIAGMIAPKIFLGKLFPLPHPAVGIALAFVVPVLAAAALGWFNGWLVTRLRIQPIIATLVLFIAGRG